MNVYQIVYRTGVEYSCIARDFLKAAMTSLLGVTTSLIGVSCSTGSTHIESADTEAASIEDTYTGISYTRVISIGGVRGTSIKGAGIRGAN